MENPITKALTKYFKSEEAKKDEERKSWFKGMVEAGLDFLKTENTYKQYPLFGIDSPSKRRDLRNINSRLRWAWRQSKGKAYYKSYSIAQGHRRSSSETSE